MKKFILFSVVFTLFCTFSYAQKGFDAKFSQPSNSEYRVAFSLTDWSIQHVQFNGEDFQQIVFNNSTVTNKKGWAELPFISAAIQLPARKNVDVSIVSAEYTDYQLDFPLVPSRGTIYRNQDPTTIPFEIDPESMINKFYPADIATADEPYIIRDVRGTSIRVFPFQYNAVSQTLRVYTKVDVLLTENNKPATNPLLTENPNPVREMRGIYPSLFLNYAEPRIPLFMAQHGEILVITTSRDAETIDSYIQWKKEKGYVVHKEIVATGTNVKSLIQQKYNANNNILYVQLVGDWADIKSDLGGGASAPTDPKMGCVVGTDNFPEIAVGRFSCSNATELTTQINKAIQYEKNPDMGTWYSSFAGIGSNDSQGPMYGDDNEYDYTHIQRIYEQRLQPTYNYNQHYRLYENESGCTATNLGNYINAGVSTIAYCGHGSSTTFVTTGFSNSNINNLTNGTKLPFIVSVACVNGTFHNSSDCFAEAWLRKQNGGAVVTWMSTINQPWSPPMRGQDYFYDILTGGFAYNLGQSGIATNELRTNWGALVVNAGDLMLTESQTTDDINTVHTWTTFGDVSLQLRTKQPAVLSVSGPPMYIGMPYTTTVTANGTPVKDALVCISQNGVYRSAFTNENGDVSIENEFNPGEVRLVVTAFNTNTFYENIQCITPSGPYMVFGGYNVVNEDKLTYISANSEIEVTLKNVGVAPTSGALTIVVSCDDPLITFNTATAQITNPIPAGGTATATFKVTVDHSIPDNKSFPVDIVVTGAGKSEWSSKMTLKAYAPNFTLEKVLVNNMENGNLSAGSVASITAMVKNNGGADAFKVKGNLEIASPYISLACEEGTRATQNLPAGGTIEIPFTVITSPELPYGHIANIDLLLSAQYGISDVEDFTVSYSGSDNYCVPGTTNCSTYGDKISSLIIVKTSDLSVVYSNTAPECSVNGYTDYTSTVLPLVPGVQYTVKVKTGYQNHRVKGWIDVNGNNTFDTAESLFTVSCTTAGTEYTANFTMPAEAAPGVHRFRIRTRDGSTAPEPCNSYTYGQTLDYSINFPELYPRVQNVEAEIVGDNITVTWGVPETGTPNSYNIYRNGTKLNSAPLMTTTFTETNIVEGIYVYNVTAVYGANESYSQMSNVICNIINLACEAPVNVAATTNGNTITLTWEDSNAMEGTLLGYNILCNGALINGMPLLTQKEYKFENMAPGEYKFAVNAQYEHCLSEFSDMVTAKIFACDVPRNLGVYRALCDACTFKIEWTEPENTENLLGYNLYRNGGLYVELLPEELFPEMTYYDENLVNGTEYCYTLSAVYEHCESAQTEKVCDTWFSINEHQNDSYTLYPNPANGVVHITSDALRVTNVEVFDIFGRISDIRYLTSEIGKSKIEINIAHLPAGVYFVRLYSESSIVAVKRMVVVK